MRDKRLVLLSAVLLSAGFAPSPLGFLGYFCLVPVMLAMDGKGPREGWKLGYLFGFALTIFSLNWVMAFTYNSTQSFVIIHPLVSSTLYGLFALLGLAVLHSIFYGAIFSVYTFFLRRNKFFVFLLPAIWTSIEYLRSQTQFAFPWANLSYTQSYYLRLIQTCDIWGDIGLSFWIVLINVLAFGVYTHRKKKALAIPPLVIAVVLFAAAWFYGAPKKYEGDIKLALLQGHFPLDVKWDPDNRDLNFEVYDSLSRAADEEGADLIVWPETAAPMYLANEPKYYNWVRNLAIDIQNYIVLGTLVWQFDEQGEGRYYNGCYQFTPMGQIQPPYKKTELVPFSERVPYSDYIPFIKKIDLGQSDFTAGDTLLLFDHPRGKYAVLICFELAFPEVTREFVHRGADFFLTITNDTWFGKTAGPYQHMQMAPFRAVECRAWIGRAANSGFSFVTDPYGRKYNRSNLWERTIVYGSVGKIQEETFFVKHGFWLPKACLVVTLMFLLILPIIKMVRRKDD